MGRWRDPRVRKLAASDWGSVGGMRRALRAVKRKEAEERNFKTLPHDRRRWRIAAAKLAAAKKTGRRR